MDTKKDMIWGDGSVVQIQTKIQCYFCLSFYICFHSCTWDILPFFLSSGWWFYPFPFVCLFVFLVYRRSSHHTFMQSHGFSSAPILKFCQTLLSLYNCIFFTLSFSVDPFCSPFFFSSLFSIILFKSISLYLSTCFFRFRSHFLFQFHIRQSIFFSLKFYSQKPLFSLSHNYIPI